MILKALHQMWCNFYILLRVECVMRDVLENNEKGTAVAGTMYYSEM